MAIEYQDPNLYTLSHMLCTDQQAPDARLPPPPAAPAMPNGSAFNRAPEPDPPPAPPLEPAPPPMSAPLYNYSMDQSLQQPYAHMASAHVAAPPPQYTNPAPPYAPQPYGWPAPAPAPQQQQPAAWGMYPGATPHTPWGVSQHAGSQHAAWPPPPRPPAAPHPGMLQ